MIGIISAINVELNPYIELMKTEENGCMLKEIVKIANNSFYLGSIFNKEVVCAASGVGTVNSAICTSIVIQRFNAESIIFSGVGGGMQPEQKIGDVVVVDETAYHDCELLWSKNYYPFLQDSYFKSDDRLLSLAKIAAANTELNVSFGRAVTGDVFIDTDGREDIVKRFNPKSVDMETAAAAQCSFCFDIPFIAIRALSDTENEHGLGTFEENCLFAAKKAAVLVEGIIKNY